MKKSHKWTEEHTLIALCPHCKQEAAYEPLYAYGGNGGDVIYCHFCNEQFELGKQK